MSDDIPLFEIAWDKEDILNVVDSIGRGSYWTKGPYVSAFEERIEEYLGVAYARVVNSGTSALMAALDAFDVGEGDEVVIPSFTFIATANAVKMVGATPVFADIERETYGLDPASVEDCITQRTAALLPIHPYGRGCHIDELVHLAKTHDLPLIEDAAESFGGEHEGTKLGTFGDAAALSFCQNKIAVTGEGGAVVTDDESVAETVERYRSHGRVSSDYFQSTGSGQYADYGANFRMSDITAALGCAQVDKVESLITKRREAAGRMNDAFEAMEGVSPPPEPDTGRHVYQLYTITLDGDVDRETVIETMTDRDIACKVYWDPPVHRTTPYRTPGGGPSLPVSDEIAGRVLSLPIYPEIKEKELERIVDAVRAGIRDGD